MKNQKIGLIAILITASWFSFFFFIQKPNIEKLTCSNAKKSDEVSFNGLLQKVKRSNGTTKLFVEPYMEGFSFSVKGRNEQEFEKMLIVEQTHVFKESNGNLFLTNGANRQEFEYRRSIEICQ